MRVVLAYLRASFLTAASYKFDLTMSYAAALFGIVPLYFISGALQPLMQRSIADQGGQYFGFLLVGISTFYMIPAAVTALPTAVGNAITTGTLEAVVATPARLPRVLTGMVSYQFLYLLVRLLLMFAAGALLGAPIQWLRLPAGLGVVALIVASYLPFALMATALVVAFRTVGRLPTALVAVSSLLGGVYYPTRVIPSWLEHLSAFIPLTYGLRALRRVMLDDVPLSTVSSDIVLLAGATAVLMAVAVLALRAALRYARVQGSLGTY